MGKFLLAVLAIALLVYAVFDLIATRRDEVRGRLPKPVWFVIVILLPVLGPILWLAVGHRRTWTPPSSGGGRPAPRPPRGPRGPDDDPDYLGNL
jgi:hypothetical protein